MSEVGFEPTPEESDCDLNAGALDRSAILAFFDECYSDLLC